MSSLSSITPTKVSLGESSKSPEQSTPSHYQQPFDLNAPKKPNPGWWAREQKRLFDGSESPSPTRVGLPLDNDVFTDVFSVTQPTSTAKQDSQNRTKKETAQDGMRCWLRTSLGNDDLGSENDSAESLSTINSSPKNLQRDQGQLWLCFANTK